MEKQLPENLNEIKPFLSEFKNHIYNHFPDTGCRLFLFGSYVRGEQYAESDIDLLLLFNELSPEIEKTIFEIKADLTYEYDKYFSVITDTQKHFDETETPLYYNIKKEGIELWMKQYNCIA